MGTYKYTYHQEITFSAENDQSAQEVFESLALGFLQEYKDDGVIDDYELVEVISKVNLSNETD